MKKVLLPWLLLGVSFMVGCGGSGLVTLQSITVTPSTATVAPNGTQQFTATGNYSDGSTKDLTTVAEWSTSNGATITVGGLATGVTPGATVQINAVIPHGEIVGFATLTVTMLP